VPRKRFTVRGTRSEVAGFAALGRMFALIKQIRTLSGCDRARNCKRSALVRALPKARFASRCGPPPPERFTTPSQEDPSDSPRVERRQSAASASCARCGVLDRGSRFDGLAPISQRVNRLRARLRSPATPSRGRSQRASRPHRQGRDRHRRCHARPLRDRAARLRGAPTERAHSDRRHARAAHRWTTWPRPAGRGATGDARDSNGPSLVKSRPRRGATQIFDPGVPGD
jgi:hypothetical protein